MPKQLTGTVTSDKGDKTIVITVRARKTHPLYKKQYTTNTKFMAHDEKNEAKVGDLVTITETRPLSARKRFALSRILEKAGAAFAETDATADVPEEIVEPKAEKPEEEAKTDEKTAKDGEAK
ncbi:30S ribosomal protein S17 [Candidatus Saccharibacteria bacterium]|nr:30S ribosomal protein S17 [Candidatus Saccharibacteria bacterium]